MNASRILPLFALAVLATSAAAQGDRENQGLPREQMWPAPTAADWEKPCLITWQRTWEDAVAVSKETGKPILVCINNAMRLARPAGKGVYKHLDLGQLDEQLTNWKGKANRAVVVTDGIFSMRGDHAPLDEIVALCRKHDGDFEENVILVVDDSHGVGGFGPTGRGTEEYTGSPHADVLVGTLGKAFGVNGGYVTSDAELIRFLRESSMMYIYSNPITVGEAAAALTSLRIVDSPEGVARLDRLRALTRRFEEGLGRVGIETIPGEHPVVPMMIRDTQRTRDLVQYLFENGVLVTGLAFPVVPRGDEEIRTQINADHTEADIDHVLALLGSYQAGTRGQGAR